MVELFDDLTVKRRRPVPDCATTPTRGEQEGSYYHGYYGQRMYHPLLVFDAETG